MKKKFINILVLISCMFSVSNAQTNLDFETWGASTYGSNDPTGWGTLNTDNILGPVSTFQETTSPGNGSSSARMVTTAGYIAVGLSNDIYGGVVSIGQSPLVSNLGIPYTQKPTSIDFLYKENIFSNNLGTLTFHPLLKPLTGSTKLILEIQLILRDLDGVDRGTKKNFQMSSRIMSLGLYWMRTASGSRCASAQTS